MLTYYGLPFRYFVLCCLAVLLTVPGFNQTMNISSNEVINSTGQVGITAKELLRSGISNLDHGMYEKANQNFFEAVRLLEHSADSLSLGYVLTNIAAVYAIPGDQKSEIYYRRALAIFRALKNNKGLAYALNLRGLKHMSNKQYEKALPEFIESALLKKKSADWQGACFAYGNLVDIHTKLNHPSHAAIALKSCALMAKKAGDRLSQVVFMQAAGMWHRSVGNYEKAILCYKSSLDLAAKIPVKAIEIENLQAISETYQAKGDTKSALIYFKEYTATRDSVEKNSNIAAIADIQLKYEAEVKDNLITQLKDLAEKKEKSRYYINTNMLALVILMLIMLAIYFRNRQKYNRKLRSEIKPDRASKAILTGEQQEILWQQLNQLLQNEKPYLNNDITLAELSRKLNTNTTYLSKVINDLNGTNFSQLLNHYRVDEACKLLRAHHTRNMTIEGIARMSGFNSKSAFNTAFKKIKNTTPSEFITTQTDTETFQAEAEVLQVAKEA